MIGSNIAGSGTYPGPEGVQTIPLPGAGDITLLLECDVLITYLLVVPFGLEAPGRPFPTWQRTATH